MIHLECMLDLIADGFFFQVLCQRYRSELEFSRNGVEERLPLDKKEIDAESDIPMIIEYGCGQGQRYQGRYMDGIAPRGLPL